MALTPGAVVAAPEPLRRRYGLFDAAVGPLDLPDHGEAGGVRYVPVTCGDAVAYGILCYEPGEAPEKPLDADNPEVEAKPFAVLSTLLCNAVGYDLGDLRTKVRRRLEGAEMTAVERALWTGLDLDGNELGIDSLDDEAAPIGIGYDPNLITDVVGALERYAYTEQGYGGVAYLHAPIEVAALAAEAGLVLPESTSPNARKLTPAGSVWAFGAYPGGEIVVTGQTTIWRSPEIALYDSFQTTTNERILVAERAYSVSFECFAGRAEYDPLGVTSP